VNGVGYLGNNLGSLSFDGADDYVDCGNNSTINLSTQGLSVSIWMKSSVANSAKLYSSKGDGILAGYDLLMSGNNLVARIADGSTQVLTPSTSISVTDGIWRNITTIYIPGTGIFVYINSSLNTSVGTSYGSILNSNNLLIGKSSSPTGYWLNGNISQVQIYNRALTASEIQQNFNALRGRFGI
jgi:hypothetical protein